MSAKTSTSSRGFDPLRAERPRLRGRIHEIAFFISLAGIIGLVLVAPTAQAVAAGLIYGIAASLGYLASTTYHVWAQSLHTRRLFRQCDHAMIYVFIAGSFTPVCMLLMHGAWRWWALGVMWAGALAGVALKVVAMDRFPRIGGALYLVLGWLGLLALPALVHHPAVAVLVLLGGTLYTVGAVLFFLRRPALRSRWFGYHELWHVLGVTAGAALFVANLLVVRAG